MAGQQPLAVASAALLDAMIAAQNGTPASQMLTEKVTRVSKLATAAQTYQTLTDQFLR